MSTEILFSEKIAVCYTVAGPTYKATALQKLRDRPKHDLIQYFLITDDRQYFSEIQSDDILIKELSEFYGEYPEIKPYEYFLTTSDLKEYGDTFLNKHYAFPFSAMRFHLKLAEQMNITNVALMATDSELFLNKITDELLSDKNKLYNAVSLWQLEDHDIPKINIIAEVIKDIWNVDLPKTFMVYDEAARFYVFENIEFMNKFFSMWHELIVQMFERNKMKHFHGTFMYNEELMLAAIYAILGITHVEPWIGLFDVLHDLEKERPWTVGAAFWRE